MKVLFCIGSLEKGGAERVISNIANGFANNNDVHIVTTINKIEYNIDERVSLHSLEEQNNEKVFLKRFYKIKKLLKLLKQIKPDIIHLHNLHSNFINISLLFNYISKN